MGIRTFKPTTAGQRHRVAIVSEELAGSANNPVKALTKGKKSTGGRGADGSISVRRRGGGHKRKYREIDFKRDKTGIPAKVAGIEYDPNRSANIALLVYKDGEKRYIVAPKGIKVGMMLMSGKDAALEVGNCLPLDKIPLGIQVHNIELTKGRGGQIVRSAGASATVVAKEGEYVTLRLPSNEMRMVHKDCIATVGEVGNGDHMNEQLGKAGRSRWLSKRPKVRGMAMNPVDHPHGGGEGRNKGYKAPVSPWGLQSKGFKTRNKHKNSTKFIVKRRK